MREEVRFSNELQGAENEVRWWVVSRLREGELISISTDVVRKRKRKRRSARAWFGCQSLETDLRTSRFPRRWPLDRSSDHISGKIKPAPAAGFVSLQRTLHLALHSSPMVQAGSPHADGAFRIEAPPGSYLLSASDRTTGKSSRPLKIEVGDRDLNGLELVLGPAYELRGHFSVDGPEHIDYSPIRVNFGWDSQGRHKRFVSEHCTQRQGAVYDARLTRRLLRQERSDSW
jgi:hypothetical protein